jgi:hypothetical protein
MVRQHEIVAEWTVSMSPQAHSVFGTNRPVNDILDRLVPALGNAVAGSAKGFLTTIVGHDNVDYVVTVDSNSKMIWVTAFSEIPRTKVP